MEIKTKLNMHETVLKLIDGKIVPILVDEIKFRIVPRNEAEGGKIVYGGIRQDINTLSLSAEEAIRITNIEFEEREVGHTIFRTKDEMISYLMSKEIEPTTGRI